MAILHVGVFDVAALVALLPSAQPVNGVPGSPSAWRFTEGDSWEEWGEGRFRATEPRRVCVVGDSVALLSDVAYVLQEDPGLLVPMTYPNQQGTIAVIGSDNDDSEQFYTLVDEQARRAIHRFVQAEPESATTLWEDPRWLEHLGRV